MAKRKTQAADAGVPPELRDDYQPLPGEIVASGGSPADDRATAAASTDPSNELSHVQRASMISDVLTGVRFHFDYEKHRGEITFEAKPEPEIRAFLKDNGYQWDRDAEVWAFPIRFAQRETDRLAAKRAFHQVVALIRKAKGIEAPSQSIPD
jgi:hypothetical protein